MTGTVPEQVFAGTQKTISSENILSDASYCGKKEALLVKIAAAAAA